MTRLRWFPVLLLMAAPAAAADWPQWLGPKRDGASTSNITSTWTAHPAIVLPNVAGQSTNRLEVTIGKDRLSFAVNGKEVYTADPRLIDAKGERHEMTGLLGLETSFAKRRMHLGSRLAELISHRRQLDKRPSGQPDPRVRRQRD